MKTHKHLWDDFISPENFQLAAKRAIANKRNRAAVRNFQQDMNRKLELLRSDIIAGRFKTSKYHVFNVYEPKQREIYKLPLYPDHVVHHALINILGPIWQKLFIYDSYACIPGRGLHAASQRCAQMVRKNKYVLQCDIRKFYPSISHDIMMRIIRRKISDRRILKLLDDIVRSVGETHGMPIGNLTSQWLGNLFMNDVDMFVKHVLRAKNYIRYCDDFCIFANDRRILAEYARRLRVFVGGRMELRFSKLFIKHTAGGVSFVGYRHYHDFVILTRAGAKKIRRKIMRAVATPRINDKMRSRLASLGGWVRWACGYNFRRFLAARVRAATECDFMRFFNRYFVNVG